MLVCAAFDLAQCRGYFKSKDDPFLLKGLRELQFCSQPSLPAAPAQSRRLLLARRCQQYEASSSHEYDCKEASSHLMPALKFELLNYISAI